MKTISLVLGSGGARGLAHIGVIQIYFRLLHGRAYRRNLCRWKAK